MSRKLGDRIRSAWRGLPMSPERNSADEGSGVGERKCLILDMVVWGGGWHRRAKQSLPASGEDQGGRAGSWGEVMPSGMGTGTGRGGEPKAWCTGVSPNAEQADVGTATHGVVGTGRGRNSRLRTV